MKHAGGHPAHHGTTTMANNMSMMNHMTPMSGNGADVMDNMVTHHGMNHVNPNMDHGNSNHLGHTGGHSLYFNFVLPINVLFLEWKIESNLQLILSCVGIFLLAVLYEGLKVWRQYLLLKKKRVKNNSFDSGLSGSVQFNKQSTSKLSRMCNGWHFLQSILHAVQTTLGMFLMLIYMTFNVYLALVVTLGSGFGYFFFAWIIPSKPNFGDHCG